MHEALLLLQLYEDGSGPTKYKVRMGSGAELKSDSPAKY